MQKNSDLTIRTTDTVKRQTNFIMKIVKGILKLLSLCKRKNKQNIA